MTHQSTTNRNAELTGEAQRWAHYALRRTALDRSYIWKKALESTRFCLKAGAKGFAVPSKLYGTRGRQDALRHALEAPCGTPLEVETKGDQLIAYLDEPDPTGAGAVRRDLGEVQRKHAGWLRLLLKTGASAYLLKVTGTNSARKFYGVNVAFGHITAALDRMEASASNGEDKSDDIVLWRDEGGTAYANVEHVERHSPTGIEWCYGGSGPSDLALSILCQYADPEEARRFHLTFKEEVISRVPYEGATIKAKAVQTWLRRQRLRFRVAS